MGRVGRIGKIGKVGKVGTGERVGNFCTRVDSHDSGRSDGQSHHGKSDISRDTAPTVLQQWLEPVNDVISDSGSAKTDRQADRDRNRRKQTDTVRQAGRDRQTERQRQKCRFIFPLLGHFDV